MGKWVKEQQDKVDKAKAMRQRVGDRQWNKKHKHQVPASYQEEDWVLVHHSRLSASPRSTNDDSYFGPYKILSVRCCPRLGGNPGIRCSTAQALLRGRMGTKQRRDRRFEPTGRCQPNGS